MSPFLQQMLAQRFGFPMSGQAAPPTAVATAAQVPTAVAPGDTGPTVVQAGPIAEPVPDPMDPVKAPHIKGGERGPHTPDKIIGAYAPALGMTMDQLGNDDKLRGMSRALSIGQRGTPPMQSLGAQMAPHRMRRGFRNPGNSIAGFGPAAVPTQ